MTCDACISAATNPRVDEFTAGCMSCMARALAATGAHEESAMEKKMTAAYLDALNTLFGTGWENGHERVKDWARIMK